MMSTRSVDVILRWGGDIVEVRRLADEESFVVGRAAEDDLFIPLDDTTSFELLRRTDAGWELRTAPGMRGAITRAGTTTELSPLTGALVLLRDDVSARLEVGPFVLEVHLGERAGLARELTGERGIASLFSSTGSDPLLQALDGLTGNRAASLAPGGGVDVRGGGFGASGLGSGTWGIGAVGTRGKGRGDLDYGAVDGNVGAHGDRAAPEILAREAEIVGTLDKELIRRVVREHMDQVRYCYEHQLQTSPACRAR